MIITDPLSSVATRLGLAPGALYTLIVGVALATALTLTGPPATFGTRTIIGANSGLGNLAAPPAAPEAQPPATSPTATTLSALIPSVSTPAPTPGPAPAVATVTTTSAPRAPLGPTDGDVVAKANIPGTVVAVATVAAGVIVAVDRDDADPLIVRLDLDGDVVGSIVLSGRDVSSDRDIVDLTIDAKGRVVALVNGPAEVLRVSADGTAIEPLGEIADLPPCGVPFRLPIPIACEPGTTNAMPLVDSLAVVGDSVAVTDPGQGVLWLLDTEGSVAAASIEVAYRAVDDEVVGLRGLVATDLDTLVGTVNDELVEFAVNPEAVEATSIATLDGPAKALDRSGRTLAVLLIAGDIVRLDQSLSPLPSLLLSDDRFTDVALSDDGLWTSRPGGVASDVRRHHIEETST